MQNISEEIFLLLSLIESYCFYRVINTIFLMKIQWKLPYLYFLRDACSRLPPADVVTVTTLLVSEFLFLKAEPAEQPHRQWVCSSATSPGEEVQASRWAHELAGTEPEQAQRQHNNVLDPSTSGLRRSALPQADTAAHVDQRCICSITSCSTDSLHFPWAQLIWRLLYSFKTMLGRLH